jgi:hypothetical protein
MYVWWYQYTCRHYNDRCRGPYQAVVTGIYTGIYIAIVMCWCGGSYNDIVVLFSPSRRMLGQNLKIRPGSLPSKSFSFTYHPIIGVI